jgi:hypothetical protein
VGEGDPALVGARQHAALTHAAPAPHTDPCARGRVRLAGCSSAPQHTTPALALTPAATLLKSLPPPPPLPSSPQVLVCTDRTSRGIDCLFCEHVVLFDFPRDPSEYVRRVGRTARGAGGRGVVSVLVLGKQASRSCPSAPPARPCARTPTTTPLPLSPRPSCRVTDLEWWSMRAC